MKGKIFYNALRATYSCNAFSTQKLFSDNYCDDTDFRFYINELLNEIESTEIRNRIYQKILKKIEDRKQ